MKYLFGKNSLARDDKEDLKSALEGVKEIKREEGEERRQSRKDKKEEIKEKFQKKQQEVNETEIPEFKKLAKTKSSEEIELNTALKSLKKLRNSEQIVSHNDRKHEEKTLFKADDEEIEKTKFLANRGPIGDDVSIIGEVQSGHGNKRRQATADELKALLGNQAEGENPHSHPDEDDIEVTDFEASRKHLARSIGTEAEQDHSLIKMYERNLSKVDADTRRRAVRRQL